MTFKDFAMRRLKAVGYSRMGFIVNYRAIIESHSGPQDSRCPLVATDQFADQSLYLTCLGVTLHRGRERKLSQKGVAELLWESVIARCSVGAKAEPLIQK